jgi:hypothetical protein
MFQRQDARGLLGHGPQDQLEPLRRQFYQAVQNHCSSQPTRWNYLLHHLFEVSPSHWLHHVLRLR